MGEPIGTHSRPGPAPIILTLKTRAPGVSWTPWPCWQLWHLAGHLAPREEARRRADEAHGAGLLA